MHESWKFNAMKRLSYFVIAQIQYFNTVIIQL